MLRVSNLVDELKRKNPSNQPKNGIGFNWTKIIFQKYIEGRSHYIIVIAELK